jgi:hypothetical protein
LSGATISSLGDAWSATIGPMMAAGFSARAAHGGSLANPFNLLNDFVQSIRKVNKRHAMTLGLEWEQALETFNEEARLLASENAAQWTRKLASRAFTAYLLTPWTQAMRHQVGLRMQATIGANPHRPWAQVPRRLRITFSKYGMGEADWLKLQADRPRWSADEPKWFGIQHIKDRALA